jgi:hypothetical protein
VLVSGSAFGARTIPVPQTAGCRSVDIIARLRAPVRPGRYLSAWQPRDGAGDILGPRLTVQVTVAGPPSHLTPTPVVTPTPVPPPRPPVTLTPTPTG